MKSMVGVCLAMAIATLVVADGLAAQQQSTFEPPVRLMAGDEYIDSGDNWGHSGPCYDDVDGDGLRDLIVGDFSGKFRVYPNVGTADDPKFGTGSYLQAAGKDAEVWVY
jgi:hypothetical protein